MANVIKLPAYQWYDPKEIDYPLPDEWPATVYKIAGADRPVMTHEQIKAAIASPIGSPRLREMARDKKKVVILFDDLTRATQVSRLAPAVLDELKEAGVPDNQVEFICAVGAHQAWDRADLAKKLGGEILNRFPVYNHVPFMNCTYLGKTSYGGKVEVSTEVMSADLKIGIGGIVPHASFGFGGGGKIIMPGVSSYEAIATHHGLTHKAFREERRKSGASFNYGFVDANPMTLEAIEMAKMAGLDFIVNCLMNHWGEPVAIYAGSLEPAYWAGVKEAKTHYRVDGPQDNDIVITNAYCKGNEAYHALQTALPHVSRKGGDLVLIVSSPLGWVYHYLSGSHGQTIGGRTQARLAIPEYINHVIVYSEFTELRTIDRFVEQDQGKVRLMSKWDDVISALQQWHSAGTKVAVFTDGTIQISG
ncbi:MAG: lactate racemase domain-containing protein [Chloroflexota bacterium]